MQYRQASCCSVERRDIVNRPVVAVKRVKTPDSNVSKKEPVVRLEESPLVVVTRKVELRRRLARLQEDYQAAERLCKHIKKDIDQVEGQLDRQSKRTKQ